MSMRMQSGIRAHWQGTDSSNLLRHANVRVDDNPACMHKLPADEGRLNQPRKRHSSMHGHAESIMMTHTWQAHQKSKSSRRDFSFVRPALPNKESSDTAGRLA